LPRQRKGAIGQDKGRVLRTPSLSDGLSAES
jgi:hypothetical protein